MKISEEEAKTEAKIVEKGLNAPRLNPGLINSKICDHTFTVLPSGKSMICEILLENGFSVRGESSTVSKENFNQEIGEEISFKDAKSKIWGFEGYLLQQREYEKNQKKVKEC